MSRQSYENQKFLRVEKKFLGLKSSGIFVNLCREIDTSVINGILSRCGKYLQVIHLPEKREICALPLVAKWCPNIRVVRCSTASTSGIATLGKKCANIIELAIFCPIYREIESALGILFDNNKSLKRLELGSCHFSGNCLNKLPLENMEKLTIIDADEKNKFSGPNFFRGNLQLTNLHLEGYMMVSARSMLAFSSCCAYLTSLSLGTDWRMRINNVDKLLSDIFCRNENIQCLKLTGFCLMTRTCFADLNADCLEELELKGNENLQECNFSAAISKCKNLNSLKFSNFKIGLTLTNTFGIDHSFSRLPMIVSSLEDLKHLSLSCIHFESEQYLIEAITFLKKLKTLSIWGNRGEDNIITDKFCEFIAKNLSEIVFVS